MEAGIPVHFGKRTSSVITNREDGLIEVVFTDGSSRLTQILFAADGSKSKVRESVAGDSHKLTYTGVTCIMGTAEMARPQRGICFPSSLTTKCHACYFPTGENEQCFQVHFPIPAEKADPGNWGTLDKRLGEDECHKLAERLRADGWDEKYLGPLENSKLAIKIGFCLLQPALDRLSFGQEGRVVLVGDAAHPPVPYLGQGAQQGLEDAGVISILLKSLCLDEKGNFDLRNFETAMKIYERMRIPRTAAIQQHSTRWGETQQKRADNPRYNLVKEELIRRDCFFHETMPMMFPGARYDYKDDVARMLSSETISPTREEG